MKVAVTGAKGRVGQHTVNELLAHGYEVRAVTHSRWDECPVEQVQVVITDQLAVRAALQGCDAVIHLAAVPAAFRDRDMEVMHTNVMGTFAVLLSCGQLGIKRAAIASSDCAFGFAFNNTRFTPDYLPMDELHPARPDNCYGISKVAAELAATGMATRYGMSIATLRITWTLPADEIHGEPFRTHYTQDPERGPWNMWSYVDGRDCARAFRLAIERDLGGHEVFCITAANSRLAMDTAEVAARYFPGVELRRALVGRESLVDCAKAREMLGFVPKYQWDQEQLP